MDFLWPLYIWRRNYLLSYFFPHFKLSVAWPWYSISLQTIHRVCVPQIETFIRPIHNYYSRAYEQQRVGSIVYKVKIRFFQVPVSHLLHFLLWVSVEKIPIPMLRRGSSGGCADGGNWIGNHRKTEIFSWINISSAEPDPNLDTQSVANLALPDSEMNYEDSKASYYNACLTSMSIS